METIISPPTIMTCIKRVLKQFKYYSLTSLGYSTFPFYISKNKFTWSTIFNYNIPTIATIEQDGSALIFRCREKHISELKPIFAAIADELKGFQPKIVTWPPEE
jgi:hypothetical protein